MFEITQAILQFNVSQVSQRKYKKNKNQDKNIFSIFIYFLRVQFIQYFIKSKFNLVKV